jgi:hypothetical protein
MAIWISDRLIVYSTVPRVKISMAITWYWYDFDLLQHTSTAKIMVSRWLSSYLKCPYQVAHHRVFIDKVLYCTLPGTSNMVQVPVHTVPVQVLYPVPVPVLVLVLVLVQVPVLVQSVPSSTSTGNQYQEFFAILYYLYRTKIEHTRQMCT